MMSPLSCIVVLCAVVMTFSHPDATFHNPVKRGNGADPWVIYINDFYYLTHSTGVDVKVWKSSNFDNYDNAQVSTVWTPPPNTPYSTDIWAPELHVIKGQLYIYFAADDHNNNANHRMYVLQGSNPNDPMQPFKFIGQLTTPDNNWAIDGTVLPYRGNDNDLYFIWSGWTDPSNILIQNLYIAKMDSPTHVTGNRVLLHEPNQPWMRSGSSGVNEGPEILVNNGRTFLIYSAAGSWTQDYCLGMMGIDNGLDPMVSSNWWRLDTRPVFWKSSEVFGVGHASFPHDRSGASYIVYHGMQDPNGGWNNRSIRAQPFTYNPDSSPAFPTPVGFEVPIPAPD